MISAVIDTNVLVKVFYSSALAEDGAKVVTGNLKHFPKTPIVVSPTEFCTILGI